MSSFLHRILFLITVTTTLLPTYTSGAFSEDLSAAIITTRMAKTTHLHFYFHDIISGKNPSAKKVIGSGQGPAEFGDTYMIDDRLTEGPEMDSKVIGKAQGMYAIATKHDMALLMVINYEFVEGKYNGSSVSILGRNPVMRDVREMPIVGGSGIFRFAKGYALAHTVWFDPNAGDATVEYNVYVQHF